MLIFYIKNSIKNLKRGVSYIDSLYWIENNKATINSVDDDDK